MATKTIAGDVATVSKSGSLDLHTVANRKASQTVLGKKNTAAVVHGQKNFNLKI